VAFSAGHKLVGSGPHPWCGTAWVLTSCSGPSLRVVWSVSPPLALGLDPSPLGQLLVQGPPPRRCSAGLSHDVVLVDPASLFLRNNNSSLWDADMVGEDTEPVRAVETPGWHGLAFAG
jgi:hypothetical protein